MHRSGGLCKVLIGKEWNQSAALADRWDLPRLDFTLEKSEQLPRRRVDSPWQSKG